MQGAAPAVSPIVPPKDPKDETTTSSFRTTQGAMDELDLIAEMEDRSRNEIVNYFLEWGFLQHWREKGMERPGDPAKALKAARDKKKRK